MMRRTLISVFGFVSLALLLFGISIGAAAQPRGHVFFAEAPALLVSIEGAPVYAPIAGTELDRLVNTRALIVRNAAGIHYLKVLDGWMEAYDLTGGWSVSGVSPFGGNTDAERAALAATSDLLGERPRPLDDDPPTVVISREPAALVVTDGPPRYEPIPGTSLRYLANSRTPVFLEPTDGALYVSADGAWYRAWTTEGPWEVLSSADLPADIARQAPRHPVAVDPGAVVRSANRPSRRLAWSRSVQVPARDRCARQSIRHLTALMITPAYRVGKPGVVRRKTQTACCGPADQKVVGAQPPPVVGAPFQAAADVARVMRLGVE